MPGLCLHAQCRFEFVVEFESPTAPERRQIWDLHLGKAPVARSLDLQAVAATYPLVGGQIRNAALTAAFAAAKTAGEIRPDDIHAAIRREYEAAGRSVPTPPRNHTLATTET